MFHAKDCYFSLLTNGKWTLCETLLICLLRTWLCWGNLHGNVWFVSRLLECQFNHWFWCLLLISLNSLLYHGPWAETIVCVPWEPCQFFMHWARAVGCKSLDDVNVWWTALLGWPTWHILWRLHCYVYFMPAVVVIQQSAPPLFSEVRAGDGGICQNELRSLSAPQCVACSNTALFTTFSNKTV